MIREYTGKDLAKVLIYYGIIDEVKSSDFNIVCPFHDDINPSMRILLDDGTFFCFGCRLSGNAYDFVRYAQPELTDLQVCVILEKIIHSKEVKKINVNYEKKPKKENKQALIEAHDYYYGLLTTDWRSPKSEEQKEVIDYIKKRGFDEKALNVSKCKMNYNIAYPFIFPILDNGKFCGWVGRTMNKYVERKRKYLYNDGFNKNKTLCGNYEENKIVFICEGFFDYLSIRTKGHIKNVVAIMGWHISEEQVKKLKDKNIRTVVSALDNDKYGNEGTEHLKKFFNVIRFPFPNDIKDTGEMTEREMIKAIRKVKRLYKNEIESKVRK